MLYLLKQKNFGLFWWSNLINVIGDHITMLAFPWIALQMTGDIGITATVLAIQGLPRAILMLLGGSITDRTTPKLIILLTNLVRGLLVLVLALLTFADKANLSHVFIVAALFGIADAFYYPASTSMVPSLLKESDRQSGNALVQVTNQLAVFLGPMIAGLVIAGQIDTSHIDMATQVDGYHEDRLGLARAFLTDSATFLLSSLLLLLVKQLPKESPDTEEAKKSLLEQIMEGIAFVWSVPAVRLCFIGIGLLEFAYHAPIFVGLPALAKGRYAEGALIFSWWISAYGIGGLLGGITAGVTKMPKSEHIARLLFIFFAWSSATIALIALFDDYRLGLLFFATGGFLDNYIWIHFMTWLQRLTPDHMMARVMSLLMFMAIGMLPVAFMLMGWLLKVHLVGTMVTAGIAMVIFCAIAALHPDGKRVEPVSNGQE